MSPIMTAKSRLAKLADILTPVQPVLLITAYFSVVSGFPPAWLIWLLFIASLVPAFTARGIIGLRTPFDIPIILFLIGLSISFSFTYYREISFDTYQTYLLCVLTYYGIVFNGLRLSWYWRLVATIIGIMALVVVIATFVQDSPGARILPYNRWLYDAASRLPFTIKYHLSVNLLGTSLGVCGPGLIAYALLSGKHPDRTVAWVLGITAILITVLSASSSGLIAILAGLSFVLWFYRHWTLLLLIPLAVAWMLLAALMDASHIPDWASWLLPHTSLIERFHIWEESLTLIAGRPITGLGPGAWFLAYNLRNPDNFASNPHNDLITITSDAGILGAAAIVITAVFAIIIIKQIKNYSGPDNVTKQWRALGLAAGVSLVALAVNGLFETTSVGTLPPMPLGDMVYHHKFVAVPLGWAILALLVVARARISQAGNKNLHDA